MVGHAQVVGIYSKIRWLGGAHLAVSGRICPPAADLARRDGHHEMGHEGGLGDPHSAPGRCHPSPGRPLRPSLGACAVRLMISISATCSTFAQRNAPGERRGFARVREPGPDGRDHLGRGYRAVSGRARAAYRAQRRPMDVDATMVPANRATRQTMRRCELFMALEWALDWRAPHLARPLSDEAAKSLSSCHVP